eukprot:TRINITY_DN32562_c0_g1_i1.p1 TRINITY_DN32562_c0_g1~~TRINITY_DN32562_c0_g1_i1.p1  ORF type:complete len:376 (-),score=79.69 TRINITY_DN32562_c0_g1_i1:122-1177(-)
MVSFEEKVEALRRLKEKRSERIKAENEAPNVAELPPSLPVAKQETHRPSSLNASDGRAQTGAGAVVAGDKPDPAGYGGVGEVDALFCAGHCHERGLHECGQDFAQAAMYYQLAAEGGHVMSQWRLGELYEFGRGVEQDSSRALHWYGLAAAAGNAQAQSSLALMLEEGNGVEVDKEAAFKWHLRAAEQGNALSQYCVGCYLATLTGDRSGAASANQASAREWLAKSAKQGFPPARELLVTMTRDEVNELEAQCEELRRSRGRATHLGAGEMVSPEQQCEERLSSGARVPVGETTGDVSLVDPDGPSLVGMAERLSQHFEDLDLEEASSLLQTLLNDVDFSELDVGEDPSIQ